MIEKNVRKILSQLPEGVELVAATKKRSIDEILRAIDAGVKIVGENYVQEAERKYKVIGPRVKWHMIGHLQKNKVKKAVEIFDMIHTVDSFSLAQCISKACARIGKVMPILIEINIGRESQKAGVFPEDVQQLANSIVELPYVRLSGVMSMGPLVDNPEKIRYYFRNVRDIFNRLKSELVMVDYFKYLSLGMSDTYRIAVEEGANMVRIGTAIFGPRQ